jgi:hypothetical protein
LRIVQFDYAKGWGAEVDKRDSASANWKALYETAVIESNIPKFRIAAAEAQNAIAHRREMLRNMDSLAAADEIADLELAAQLLTDLVSTLGDPHEAR